MEAAGRLKEKHAAPDDHPPACPPTSSSIPAGPPAAVPRDLAMAMERLCLHIAQTPSLLARVPEPTPAAVWRLLTTEGE